MNELKRLNSLSGAVLSALWCLIMCVLALGEGLHAQRLEWNVDFNTVFDNRECDNKMTDTKTFFQTQLAPEIGVSVKEGMHSIMGRLSMKSFMTSNVDSSSSKEESMQK